MNIYQSILFYKCPRCRKGDLFKKPFSIKNPLAMHKHCSNCKQNFEPEPGFYYGAMYISYIVASILLLPLSFISVYFFGLEVWQVAVVLVVVGVLLYVRLLRQSRALFIHIVVQFDENFLE